MTKLVTSHYYDARTGKEVPFLMEESGSYQTGKTFRHISTTDSERRWAKVTVLKSFTKTTISVAYGEYGSITAKDVANFTSQKDAKAYAIDWIARGWF